MRSTAAPSRRSNQGGYISFVKPQYRKDYQIPILNWQQNGILSRSLWNTEDHIIRIVPGYDKDTGEVFRQNVNCNEYCPDSPYGDYLSETFFMCNTVQYFGERKQSFIIDYAPGSKDEQKYGGDSVIRKFIYNVINSVTAKPGKSKFGVSADMRRWAGQKGTLRYPKSTLMVQALLFMYNGKVNAYKDENGNYVELRDENGEVLPLFGVIGIEGKSTINNVLQSLVEPSDPGRPLDGLTNNKYGGMAELDGNKMFLNHYVDPESKHNSLRVSVQAAGKGWTPSPYPLDEEIVRSLWVPWDDLLYFMTAEEQLQFLATEFGADAVNYLIGTDPMFSTLEIPQEIAAQGLGQYQQFVDYGAPQTITMPNRQYPQSAGIPRDEESFKAHPGAPTNPTMGGLPKRPAGLSGAGLAQRPAAGVGGGLPQRQAPAGMPKNPLSGVQGNSIDRDKLAADISRIRSATGTLPTTSAPVDAQADAAASLLDDDTDYGDIPVSEYEPEEQ